MRRVGNLYRLTALKVDKLARPGRYEDGGGLRLIVDNNGRKRWIVRLTIHGRRADVGLGGYPTVSLEDARTEAEVHRRTVREGGDPIRQRRLERGKKQTFRQAFDVFFESKKKTLSNGKHLAHWQSSMETYVFPKIGSRSVADVTPGEIVAVLKPIWWTKAETAKRLLRRMRNVFDAAIVLEHREKANPCTGVAALLGTQHHVVRNLPALPFGEVGSFIRRLRASQAEPVTKLAFEWLILTAVRSGEARLASMAEVDPEGALWTIPKERMKGIKGKRREHIVPLSRRCLEIYREALALNPNSALLFPSRKGKPLSDMTLTKLLKELGHAATAHGFRTSFKTWCAEIDKVRDEVSEAALAHVDKDQTRAAYRRTTYLDERRGLMQRWADFVLRHQTSEPATGGPANDNNIAAPLVEKR